MPSVTNARIFRHEACAPNMHLPLDTRATSCNTPLMVSCAYFENRDISARDRIASPRRVSHEYVRVATDCGLYSLAGEPVPPFFAIVRRHESEFRARGRNYRAAAPRKKENVDTRRRVGHEYERRWTDRGLFVASLPRFSRLSPPRKANEELSRERLVKCRFAS